MLVVLIFLIYFVLTFIETRIPIIPLCIYSIGETIITTFNLFSIPLRYLLPNLTDDEYYVILLNFLITIFAFIYAYLLCKLTHYQYNSTSIHPMLSLFRYYSS